MNTSIALENAQVPSQAEKTKQLQAQFICPIWAVWFGTSVNVYVAKWHAEQMMRALTLNGTPCLAFDGKGNSIGSERP